MSKTSLAIVLVLSCASAYGQGPVPVAEEFQVNTYTTYGQFRPAVATLTDGSLVAVWHGFGSPGSDTASYSVQGRRYATDGTPAGDQFQVNSQAEDIQWNPAVTALPGAGFAVVWHSRGPDDGAQLQRYAAGGVPVGPQVRVNPLPDAFETKPAATTLTDGGFVVLWQGAGSSGDSYGIHGQRFAADGTPTGSDFQVNSYFFGSQSEPAVAALADGGFVALWQSWGSSGSDSSFNSIQGQRFGPDGNPAGLEFQVNTYTTDSQWNPAVTGLADGGFVALWQSRGSRGSDTSETSIQGRQYAPGATSAGPEFQVNSFTGGHQRDASVAATAGGGFVVAWDSWGSNGSDRDRLSVQSQRYDAGGRPLGGQFQVNSYTTDLQRAPSVTALADGGFAVVWQSWGSNGSDDHNESIQSRQFAAPRFSLAGLGGKCLDVEGANPADGTPVNIYRCNGGEHQRWRLDLTAVPQRIVGLGGKCLIPDAGGRAVIGECGGAGDLWQLLTSGPSSPSILIHTGTGLCLDVEDAVPADGTPVQLFECHGGANQVWRPATEVCTPDSQGLCLNQERFQVELAWRSFDDTTGSGRLVPVGTDDSGLLWFFEADNWEMLVKVLDGCAINDRFWVFAAATTTVEYTLRVTDTALGTIREYFNPLGDDAAAITDTDAFATCSATSDAAVSGAAAPTAGEMPGSTPIDDGSLAPLRSDGGPPAIEPALKGACVPSFRRMCLSGGRFSAEVEWRDYNGDTGFAKVYGADSPDSGLFWFFNSNNWEMLVKVLDACHLDDPRFLLLAAATTDVEYRLRVTDTETQVFREYFNPLGNAASALVDTFETCR